MILLYVIAVPIILAPICYSIFDALGTPSIGVLLWIILTVLHLLHVSKWKRH